ncbi:hypothetical protein RA16_08080 [Levilactobacillus brevis]|uniref:MerR family transcriptional regulator n=1 Tax=Levilactobacillus brevis TaxID=1580 RepID=UPI0005B62316|nr:MerR family transcriptional regulator [Levilactobacillus brevis]KIR08451.1 hypothetical protein RA16_08080 [Levilactobacillus brevis]
MTYGIKEVANLVNVTQNALRYYEKVSVIDEITRDKNGVRQYTDKDVERIQMAIILRNMGMPINEVRSSLHQLRNDPTLEELYAFKENISELLDQLDERKKMIDLEKQHVQDKIKIVDDQIRRKKENPSIKIMISKRA